MATGRIYHEIFLDHGEPWHVENGRRLEVIVSHLETCGLWTETIELPVAPVGEDVLRWVHTADYLEYLRFLCEHGGGAIDPDTVATATTYGAAVMAAGGCIEATRQVMAGSIENAVCLVRPPGHHALPHTGMGFCFLNNIALAAEYALRAGLGRVAIIDWDSHHGNGTQEIFYHRGDVQFFSTHDSTIFPGTGTVDETGVDAGAGSTVNIPFYGPAMDKHLLAAHEAVIIPAMHKYRPEMIFISAGYDGHHTDPLTRLAFTTDAWYNAVKLTLEAAAELCEGRVCVILEGGYALEPAAHGVENTILAMMNRPLQTPEPDPPQVHPTAAAAVDKALEQVIAIHRARLDIA